MPDRCPSRSGCCKQASASVVPVSESCQKTYCRHWAAGGTAVVTEGNPIRLFVTHLFAPDESYFRVFEFLESQPNYFYVNLATPEKPPRSKEKEAIREDLRRQMADAEVVVVLSSLYLQDP